MSKKSVLKYLRIAFTTALLVYVFHKSGLLTIEGWKDLFQTFSHANLSLILLSFLLVPLIDFISSFKWFCLSEAFDFSVSLWRLFAYYLIGRFFNLILPSSIGGDVIRIHEVGRFTGRYADAAAVVFVERFSGLAILVLLAMVAVIVNLQIFNIPWLTTTLIFGFLGLGFICWLIIDERPFKFTQKHLGRKIPLIAAFLEKLGKFRKATLVYRNKPRALWIAVINSLLFYLFAIINVWVCAVAFDRSIDFMSIVVATPVMMFIMNLPFSIGGIGLMEFAYSFTLSLFGISPTVAISTALLMRLKTFIAAGIGFVIYSFISDEIGSPKQISKSIDTMYEERNDS